MQEVRVETSEKKVRALLGGEKVVESIRPLLVWEKPYYPTYFFPRSDVFTELTELENRKPTPGLGEATFYSLTGGAKEGLAYGYRDSPIPELSDAVAFRWSSMDHWFEEDEEVYVHARDPHTRVDILHSSRHVTVTIEGVQVAESNHPTLLFETALPTRFYLPKTDVRMELLHPIERKTECPYKGTAEYWSVDVNGEMVDGVVWSYPFPTHESSKIAGLLCFYNERVDMTVDGLTLERPRSPFS